MSRTHLWLALVIALVTLAKNQCEAAPEIASADLPLEARNGDADSAEDDTLISTSYVLPNQIFNDGKPYYASKDPISGQLDFSAKKPAGIETAANEVFDPKEKIVMSSNAPNIHDYLNLPVKYSSSKFVYPLVSSSYANLKYQGSNKNYITNKKPTSVVATPVTPAPSHNYYTIPTTKLMAVPPTAPGLHSSSGSSSATAVSTSTTSTTSSTTTTTSKKPTTATSTTATKASSTSTIPPTTSTTTTTSTSTTTTAEPSSPKYTTSTRKPFPPLLSTSIPQVFDSSTRKKFIPTKKYITSTTTTSATPATPMRFPDQTAVNTTGIPKPTTTGSVSYTTRAPSSLATTTHFVPSTKQPIIFTEDPSGQLTSALPTPVHTHVPELNIADVYQTLGQKNTEQKVEQKPSMSLADIFNSLADEESAVASQNQGSQGFDAQGNYMQPISLAKPAPFAMQQQHQHQQHHQQQQLPSQQQQYNQKQQHQQQFQRLPQQPTHPTYQTHPTYPTHGTTPLPGATGEGGKVISGSKENYSGEYVSYQVQQPNVMQYRPAPGAINNVVISPGQHSASFVLGSQQQVGSAAFGSVEKEPLFSKDPPVQYGTVISEDISALSRPAQGASSSTGTYPPGAQSVSNFHQNGNFGASVAGPTPPYVQRPMGTNAPTVTYSEEPPAAPSLYQQLPLIGSNLRQRKPPKPLALPQTAQNNYQPTAPTQTPVSQVTASTESNGAQDTKELLVSTNIRFPSNEEQSNEEHSVPVIAGPPAGPQVNGHAQPLSLQQLQNANNVVFPKGSEDEMSNVAGGVSNADVLIQKHEVLTMNQHKQKLSFPPTQLDQNTPSQHMEPPPRFPPSVANAIPEQTELHKRPQLPSRPAGPSSSFAYNDYTRKPIPGITRPNPERHLPNILPQFRPNAKISSGHSPAQNFNQEPGNIRISGQTLKRPNSSPQFAHRRQPLLQQQMHRYPLNRAADFGPGSPLPSEANRRVYRLPPYGGQGVQYLDRMYPRRPLPAPQRGVDNYERHAAASNPEMYKTIMAPERLAAFEEEDLVINDPPQPVSPEQEEQPVDKTKLEPVVTLQMLQSQKKPLSLPNDDTGSGEIQVTAASEQTESQIDGIAGQNGLYVVYPSRGDKTTANSDIADIKEQLPAIAHVEPPTGSDYQNTPFSVVRDQPQEPILKNKKPQSLQQQTKSAQLVKDKFPYPIEKPDLSYSELNAPLPATVIGPRIISGTYGVGIPDTPIAIAYSPTEPSPYRRTGVNNAQRFSNVNLASSVISEIRTDTQTEEGINNDFDMRGQNLEKNFMAPFYPSVSLGSATNAPSNGWNILPSTTEQTIYEKNNINRADVGETAEYSETTTAKTFEIDSFQPELQGGFKPIYPPGYKVEEEGAHAEERKELFADENDKPLALASYMRPQSEEDVAPVQASASTSSTSTTTTTTSTTTTTTTSTTPKPATSNSTERPKNTGTPNKTTTSAESVNASTSAAATSDSNNAVKVQTTKAPSSTKKKSTFETSLAALLFGDDEEFEEDVGGEARKQQQQSQQPLSATVETKTVSAGPRTGAGAPRMGPRSLKIR